jgi:hypothetical protein
MREANAFRVGSAHFLYRALEISLARTSPPLRGGSHLQPRRAGFKSCCNEHRDDVNLSPCG